VAATSDYVSCGAVPSPFSGTGEAEVAIGRGRATLVTIAEVHDHGPPPLFRSSDRIPDMAGGARGKRKREKAKDVVSGTTVLESSHKVEVWRAKGVHCLIMRLQDKFGKDHGVLLCRYQILNKHDSKWPHPTRETAEKTWV